MKLYKSFIALALAGLSAVSLNAQAHKPWLLPSSTIVEGKEAWLTVDAAISEGLFDIDHQPLKLDGIVITGPDGGKLAMENVNNGKLRNTFDLKLPKPGTYKIALVSQGVTGSYKSKEGEMKRFRGSEETLAKDVPADATDVKLTRMQSRLETFVSTGAPDLAVFKPTGVGLELVPVTHPNDMRAGEKATWRFLLDGKPAANQGFSLIPGGVRYRGTLGELRKNTDANGEVTFELPAAGMYLVSSAWPAVAPQAPGQPPQMPPRRVSYAATVEILPQ
ncbi:MULTISPECIES: DUF4198 domain-containing protein [unclassified Duganella]|uniref:DUF4198 domain-containing protein n=1 Tax=unclassified Duganella TaxID=2636909 RepID=UPI000E355070|nr:MULTISPECIES: DUF4198 domain-containing protein [unclassified Duganella]RFP14649.1 DUF4198 domain-containing protein [Duganella sp. BJB475]RFP30997.1 DUF4198 domain-containing protein [Duganella sp. BJB476]